MKQRVNIFLEMKIRNANLTICKKCLQESLPIDMMIRFAKLAIPNYNIYSRTGLEEGMPISKQYAAQRIVTDMIQDGYYIDFVEAMVQIDANGYMGKRYSFKGLKDVVEGLIDEGYSFDKVSGQFMENQRERISSNWGRLREGDERKMTLLRFDIADNSTLVKNNPRSKIDQAYNDLRNIVIRAVTTRLGRLWSWEGDGVLAAFLFGPKEKMVVYAGMEILHEIFFYNRLRNPLGSPINIRLGAHIGQVWYSNNEADRLRNETVKEASILEGLAGNNALCVSYNLYITMDQYILNLFSGEKTRGGRKFRLYKAGIEK